MGPILGPERDACGIIGCHCPSLAILSRLNVAEGKMLYYRKVTPESPGYSRITFDEHTKGRFENEEA